MQTDGGLNDLYNVKTFTKLVGLNCINNDDISWISSVNTKNNRMVNR